MANSIDALGVASWRATTLPDNFVLTRFMMSVSAHETLVQWSREKTKREKDLPMSVTVAGLSEILAFFAPETAYMAQDRDSDDNGPRRQCLYFLGDVTADSDLSRRLRSAILIWLGIVYPEKDAEVRASIGGGVSDSRNWRVQQITTRFREPQAACPVPEARELFDVLTAHVVAQLANKTIQFQSGENRILIPRTPQSRPFEGVDLVAFPPKKERNGDGFYTEVVAISAATFPEQHGGGIQILAQPSVRNWGPVTGYDMYGGRSRSLDLFMRPQTETQGHLNYRHTSFGVAVIVENMVAVKKYNASMKTSVRWEAQRDHRIVDLMRRLSGSASKLEDADYTRPVTGEEDLWILPRLGPGSGDRYLAGGSGVGWDDRNDIADSLDGPMHAVGFKRAETMSRVRIQMPIKGLFNVAGDLLEVTAPERRAGLLRTLASVGNTGGELDLIVFHMRERSPDRVREEVKRFLGTPDQEHDCMLAWQDGLKVRLLAAPSGPLAQALEYYELPEDRKSGLTQRQQNELKKAGQQESDLEAGIAMWEHVARVRAGRTGVACAIVELASSLKGLGPRDPYAMARLQLAKRRVLPQVVLVGEDAPEEKYRSAVRDWFRMLGVLPAFEQRFPFLPAAFTVIQRNKEVVGGGSIKGQAFPLAARVRDGLVECALPDELGTPNWMPYALAALRILSGDYGRFARNRNDENLRKFSVFFATALEQIDRLGTSLVILDMDTVASKIPALSNNNLVFDNLEIGNRMLQPSDLPNTRIIRVCANTAKLPCYMQTERLWPQGLFRWASAIRTAYGVKRKPLSAKVASYASMISRHLPPGDNRAADHKHRRIAALDEICLTFEQPGDDAVQLLTMAHRLRSVHAQFDDDTCLPFPLHELCLLGEAVTS